MTKRAAAAVLALAAAALPARAARAEEAGIGGGEMLHRVAGYGVVGIGTPLGVVGFEGVFRIVPTLEISAGIGFGMTAMEAHSGSPLQWAVMPRLRVGQHETSTFTLGAGASGGNIGDVPLFCDEYCDAPRASYPTHYFLFANVELGGEHWFSNGFALRYFAGVALGWETANGRYFGLPLPYTGVGLGRAF
jgi:hypothetical protein